MCWILEIKQKIRTYLCTDFRKSRTKRCIYKICFEQAKLPFLLSILSYLFTGNDNFREERREKSEKRIEQKKRQLSVENCRFFLAGAVGFEPTTYSFGDCRSTS